MSKSKKTIWIVVIALDILITLFLFCISIAMLATMPTKAQIGEWKLNGYPHFIAYLQGHPTLYLCVGVLPLIVLLILNIVGVVYYIKKMNAKKQVVLNELTDEQKEALRQELLKDLQEPNKE